MKKVFVVVCIWLSMGLYAQVKVSGTVVDEDGLPVAFADVYFPGTDMATSTNTDGGFYIESQENMDTMVVSQIEYEDAYVELHPGANFDLTVELSKSGGIVALKAISVTSKTKEKLKKKENPAYAIMRKLWKNKRKNGLKKFPNYHYEEYEKIQFDLNNVDSTLANRKALKKFDFVFENIDTSRITGSAYLPLFLNEAIYNVNGQNQPTKKERRDLIANKTSGFEQNEIVANTAKNLYREFDIYSNRLNFFQKSFMSPLARDGFGTYEYRLLDTLEVDGKACYRIKYFPKRSNELTFKGDFCVDSTSYAISEITMQSTKGINVNFVKDVYVELDYDIVNDSVFLPKREYYMIDMSLLNKKKKSRGLFAHRTISYNNYNFNEPKGDKFYQKKWDPFYEGAYEDKPDSYWEEARHEELTKDQEKIYTTLDKLAKVPLFKKMVKGVETLASGYYNVGNAIDIGDIYSFVGYNDIEGLRLRGGARTYFSKNDMWRAAFFTAYGFKDHQIKYGVELRKMFNRYNRFTMGIGTKRDIEQLGARLTTADGIMTRSFASSSIIGSGSNTSLSSVNKTNAFISIDPIKNFTIRLDGTYQTIKSANPSEFSIAFNKNGKTHNDLIDSKLSLSLTARPGAKYSRYGLDRYEHSSLAPTIMLRYTKGFNGVLDSDYNYDKLQLYFTKPFLIGLIGRSDVSMELGKTFQAVPLSLLSVIPANQSLGYVPGTFSLLNYYDFVSDTYGTLSIDHHFNGHILSHFPIIKKWKLRTVGFWRGAYGSISDRAREINASGITYRAPSKNIYYEYGFGIENIGLGNIRPLRVNFNWRGNYFDLPDAEKFKVTVGMQFTF